MSDPQKPVDLSLDPTTAEGVVGGAAKRVIERRPQRQSQPAPRMIVVTGTHTPGDAGPDAGPDPNEADDC